MGAIDAARLTTELSLGSRPHGKAEEAEALRSFEAYFLGELLRIAAPSNPSGLFDGGQAGRMYREHLYQELARVMAANGGVGLADSLAGQLAKPAAGDAPRAAAEAGAGDEERMR